MQSCPRRRTALATYRPTRWATRGAPTCFILCSLRRLWQVCAVGLVGRLIFQTGVWPLRVVPVNMASDQGPYFDAVDRDGVGKIVQSEVSAIEPMVGFIYPSPADMLLSFSYEPAVGLSYQIDGYHYRIDFGKQAFRYSDTGSTRYSWAASTVSSISAPVPVPEPPRLMMTIGGLGLMGLVLAWRRNRT